MTKPIFLELFSGTKTMSKTAEDFGYQVFNIDIDESLNPTLAADIFELTVEDIETHCGGRPDVIWASPDCTQFSFARGARNEFSRAAATAKIELSEDAQRAVELVRHTLALIDGLEPVYAFIENPYHGALKNQSVIAHLPFVDVYYCAYDWPHQKKTRIWGNHPPQWRARTTCSHSSHINCKTQANARLRSEIPVLLSQEIFRALSLARALGNPQLPSLEDF